MSDTCIVCLGELATTFAPPALEDDEKAAEFPQSKSDDDSVIAHLLPCGHNLHDACLRPWVERANSCPICRATFNKVDMVAFLDGPVLSSYNVKDKVQVADLDPNLVADLAWDDDHNDPCMVCDVFGDESQLLLCDGCTQSCHVFCAGLDSIPAGSWFCYDCQRDPQVIFRPEGHGHTAPQRASGRPRQRANRANRASRSRNQTTSAEMQMRDPRAAWARLWRSVASRTAIDLDFPFDEEESPEQQSSSQRRELREWQRRLEVANQAAGPGAANQFREIAPVREEPTQQISPESQEELRAWNAFDKALIINHDQPGRRGRKRKSPETSPEAEPQPEQPPRKRKRPRTLRTQDADLTDSAVGESSRSARPSASRPQAQSSNVNRSRNETAVGPTFLQSLLDEVEATNSNDSDGHSVGKSRTNGKSSRRSDTGGNMYDANGEYFPFSPIDRASSSSPDPSPPGSNLATPRSMTPPPLQTHILPPRPASPTSLTSNISPIFPPAPLPSSGNVNQKEKDRAKDSEDGMRFSPIAKAKSRESKLVATSGSGSASSPIAIDTPEQPVSKSKPEIITSPSKSGSSGLDFATKSQLQGLVKSALRPFYHSGRIEAAEYTRINKSVSRYLYDKVASQKIEVSEKGKEKEMDLERWRSLAGTMVGEMVEKVKEQSS